MKKKVVEFLETVSPYQKGEIAGFDPEYADKLIDAKKAVEYKQEKKTGTSTGAEGSQTNPPA